MIRAAEGVLIVAHRLGFVMANAGIDQSNIEQASRTSVLLLPRDPDAAARGSRPTLDEAFGRHRRRHQRQFRPALAQWRHRRCARRGGYSCAAELVGRPDLFGRKLRMTEIAVADEIAAGASLVMGQAAEGMPAVLVRGFDAAGSAACRPRADPAEAAGSVPMSGVRNIASSRCAAASAAPSSRSAWSGCFGART